MMSTRMLKTKDKRSTGEEKETMPKSPTPSTFSHSILLEGSFTPKNTDSTNSPNKARVTNDGNESMVAVNSSKSSSSKSAKPKKGGRGRSVKSSNKFLIDGRKSKSQVFKNRTTTDSANSPNKARVANDGNESMLEGNSSKSSTSKSAKPKKGGRGRSVKSSNEFMKDERKGQSKSKTKKKKAWERTPSSDESEDFIVPLPVEYQGKPADGIFYVEDIRDKRIVKKRRKGGKGKPVLEYLVKWQGYPESENTWEPREGLQCLDDIEAFERRYAVSAEFRSPSSSDDEYFTPLPVSNQEVTTTVPTSGNARETNDCETSILASESNDIKACDPDGGPSPGLGSMKIKSRRSSPASEISVTETTKLYNSGAEADIVEQTGRIAVEENKVVEMAWTKSTEVGNGQNVLAKEADAAIFPICVRGEAEFPRSNWEEHGFRNPKIICTCVNHVTKTFKFLVRFEGIEDGILVDKDLCNEAIPLEVIRFYESY